LQKIDTLERKNEVFKEDIRKFQDKVSILQDASDQKHRVEDSVAVAKLGQLEVPDSSLVLSQRRLLYWRARAMLPILEALESCMSDDLKTKFRSLRNALVWVRIEVENDDEEKIEAAEIEVREACRDLASESCSG
jgi:hypothetical protein